MNATTRKKWAMFHHYTEPRSWCKTIDIERTLSGFSCGFEVTLKLWEDNAKEPSIECVSAVEAFDNGGHQVTNPATINTLNTLAEQYAKEHLDEIVEQIQKEQS